MVITDDLVNGIKEWLGKKGIAFFRGIKEKYGELNAVWMEGEIPHSVHFREGMQVRNQMRRLCNNAYSADEYDDNWVEVVERAIKEM
jgi:hypothetical protein